MNLATNTILKSMTDKKDYSIDITYHPLENQLFATLQAAQPNPAFTLLVPVVFGALVPIGLALFAASYAVFPTEERLSNSKQLQLMTGVNTLTFWGTSFVWDFFIMTVAILLMVIAFPIFENEGSFTAHDGFGKIKLRLTSFARLITYIFILYQIFRLHHPDFANLRILCHFLLIPFQPVLFVVTICIRVGHDYPRFVWNDDPYHNFLC